MLPPARSSIIALALSFVLGACTPQAALLASLIPEGTVSTLLGHLERVGDENRQRVLALERAKNWDELARFAELNLAKEPSNADWWLIAGYARSEAGDHRAAAKAFAEAVRLEPDAALGWNMLAQSHRAAGDSARAVNVLNNAMFAVRDAPLTVFLLGESYSDIGRYEQAVTAYQQAIAMEAKFPAAWFGLGRAYARLGRMEEARQARVRLEELDPKLARRLGVGAPDAGAPTLRR